MSLFLTRTWEHALLAKVVKDAAAVTWAEKQCPSDPTLGTGAVGGFEGNACHDWCAGDASYAGNFLVNDRCVLDHFPARHLQDEVSL